MSLLNRIIVWKKNKLERPGYYQVKIMCQIPKPTKSLEGSLALKINQNSLQFTEYMQNLFSVQLMDDNEIWWQRMSNIESKEEKRHLLKETVYKAPVCKYSECKYIAQIQMQT